MLSQCEILLSGSGRQRLRFGNTAKQTSIQTLLLPFRFIPSKARDLTDEAASTHPEQRNPSRS